MRTKVSFLCVLVLDTDGAAASTYANLTHRFRLAGFDGSVPPEVLAYVSSLQNWLENGHHLEIACALHNVECQEAPTLSSPLVDLRRGDDAKALNHGVLYGFSDIETREQPLVTGFVDDRLIGWCGKHWGTLVTALEVNSRYPSHRLTQCQVEELGAQIAMAFVDYMQSRMFATEAQEIERMRRVHLQQLRLYWASRTNPETPRTLSELLTLAY